MRQRVVLALTASLAALAVNALALDLVRAGAPACTIVIPDQANQSEQDAAATLARYVKMSSGADLPVAKESAKPQGALIAVGRTALAASAGLTSEGLKHDGYRLAVRGTTLFVVGRDTECLPEKSWRVGAQGSVRAAFGLLEQLGFRWLQPTPKGTHVPSLKTLSVPDGLAVTHEPPFMYVAGRMYTYGDWSMANSFRKAVKVYSQGGHTWDVAVPAALYDQHPEYFRMQGGVRIRPAGGDHQLCASNPDVVRLITEHTLKKCEEGFDVVALGQPDAWKPCECAACQAMGKGLGYDAYEQVHLTQYKVIEAVRQKYPDRLVHLLIYGPTQKPSEKFRQYPPNTIVEVCLAVNNAEARKQLDLWNAIVPGGCTVYVYYLGLYHNVGLAPKFTPRQAAEALRQLVACKVKGIYFCGAGENWGAEGPVYYTLGRLAADPSLEWRAAVDEYCRLTFGQAGVTMRQRQSSVTIDTQ